MSKYFELGDTLMRFNKKLFAVSAAAVLMGYSLPVSAQTVYYTQTSPTVIPTTSFYTTTSPTYTTRVITHPVITQPRVITQPVVITQPAVMPSGAYVDTRTNVNPLGRAVTGGAVGAGLGALGGLIYGSVTRERLGRSVVGGTAAGAAIGAGASLLGGLFSPRVETRQVASPGGYYWY
jgi:hypothetical protein